MKKVNMNIMVNTGTKAWHTRSTLFFFAISPFSVVVLLLRLINEESVTLMKLDFGTSFDEVVVFVNSLVASNMNTTIGMRSP